MTLDRKEFLRQTCALPISLLLPVHLLSCTGSQDREYDLIVYGATSGGIIAAVAAANKGKTVLLIEPSNHLGGLTTGGLGRTDIGIEGAIGGMSQIGRASCR